MVYNKEEHKMFNGQLVDCDSLPRKGIDTLSEELSDVLSEDFLTPQGDWY